MRHSRKRPSPSAAKRVKRLARYAFLRLVFWPLRFLPRAPARAVGAAFGRATWLLVPDLRRRSLENLATAFPHWPQGQRRRVAREALTWIGRAGTDFLRLGCREQAQLLDAVQVEGLEHWKEAEAAGRGVIAATGHFGNWELLGVWLAQFGGPVWVFYHRFAEGRLDRLVRERRERVGVLGLPADRGGLGALRALRRGQVLGILIDRVPRGPSVACRFFGRECRAAPGAAYFAVRTSAAIVPVALWEVGRGGHRLRFHPPLWADSVGGTVDDRVAALTRCLTAILEEQIREAPEQWPWFYNRWKIRPGPLVGGPLPDGLRPGPGGPLAAVASGLPPEAGPA